MVGSPKLPLTNFSKGEFAPVLYARVDVPQYSAGAKKVRNWLILRQGGLFFRPGFQFVAPADSVDGPERMFPFQFSQRQGYVHAMSNYRLRNLARGGLVVADDLQILSITRGNPTVLEIAYHNAGIGDWLYLDGIVGTTQLNGRYVKVLNIVDPSHITVDIDSTAFGAFASSSGTSRTAAPVVEPTPTPLDPPPPPSDPAGVSTGSDLNEGPGGYLRRKLTWMGE